MMNCLMLLRCQNYEVFQTVVRLDLVDVMNMLVAVDKMSPQMHLSNKDVLVHITTRPRTGMLRLIRDDVTIVPRESHLRSGRLPKRCAHCPQRGSEMPRPCEPRTSDPTQPRQPFVRQDSSSGR